MKKFLAILLIAIVACSTAPVADEENVLAKLLKGFKKGVQLLKEKGLLAPIVKMLKSAGIVVPKELCLKVLDEELCDELALKKSEDGEVVLNEVPWGAIIGLGSTLLQIGYDAWKNSH